MDRPGLFHIVPGWLSNPLKINWTFPIQTLILVPSVPNSPWLSHANLYPISIPNTEFAMRTNLTPAGIRAAIRAANTNHKRLEQNDPATPGLNLRVAPSGRATWTWMGRD